MCGFKNIEEFEKELTKEQKEKLEKLKKEYEEADKNYIDPVIGHD